jgi:hypothetical protein
LIKISIYLYLIKNVQATEEAFSPQKRTSSTSKHEISNFYLFLKVIFALLDLDPDFETGSGSTDLIEIGTSMDPDLKHWF